MSLKPSMYVICITTNNGFFPYNLYELLPILPVNNFKFEQGMTIPFFGYEDTIVSIIPNQDIIKYKRPRGLRKSAFGHSVAIDFQTMGKNIHLKISSSQSECSKIHINGTSGPEMATEVANRLKRFIENMDLLWRPFFMLSSENKINLVNIVIDEIVDCGTHQLIYGDPLMIERLNRLKDKIGDQMTVVDMMLRFTVEPYSNFQEYKKRLYDICSIVPGSYSIFHGQEAISFKSLDIYGGVYNGKINCKGIILHNLSNCLHARGYNCEFHNVKKTSLKVSIPILDSNGNSMRQNCKKIMAHNFTITDKGGIKLYSNSSPQDALNVGLSLISTIEEIITTPEYFNSGSSDFMTNSIKQTEQQIELASQYQLNDPLLYGINVQVLFSLSNPYENIVTQNIPAFISNEQQDNEDEW